MSPEDQMLAAELALGLLDGAEHTAARARVLADPAFAAETAWWRDRLGGLAGLWIPAEPPAGLLQQIEAALDGTPGAAPLAAGPGRWRWFGGGAVAGALAAGLAALLLMPGTEVVERRIVQRVEQPVQVPVAIPAAPPLVAILAPGEGTDREPVAAVFDRQTRTLRLTAIISVPENRVAELWRIGSDQVPRPLGLLTTGARTPIEIDQDLTLSADEIIAISIEPVGGSPTGSPTGEVIASGALQPT